MKFGFAEMAQIMDAAKELITVTLVSSVVIGVILGAMVALFVAFLQGRLYRYRVEPRLTKGQILTPNSMPGPMPDQLAREGTPIGNDIIPDYRVPPYDDRVSPRRLSIFLFILSVGSFVGGVVSWHYALQRTDTPQRSDTPQKPSLPPRAPYIKSIPR